MNDQFSTAQKIENLIGFVFKRRFVGQKFVGNAMHFNRALIDFTVRIKILMQRTPSGPPIDNFNAANFDNAMALFRFKTGGFGIENNLSGHDGSGCGFGLREKSFREDVTEVMCKKCGVGGSAFCFSRTINPNPKSVGLPHDSPADRRVRSLDDRRGL